VEEAAARLFTRSGYTATTMQAIAEEAGVHVQTIYLAYRTKAAVLAACASRLVAGPEDPDTHPSERRWARRIAAEPNPREKLALYVKHIATVASRVTQLIDVLRATAPAEPDVDAFLSTMEHGRREGALQLLGHGVSPRTWRPELTPDLVADIVSTLASPDTLRWLITRCGWEPATAQQWVVHALERELLPGPDEKAITASRRHQ
jgi:AcrR family transcriptional regulator